MQHRLGDLELERLAGAELHELRGDRREVADAAALVRIAADEEDRLVLARVPDADVLGAGEAAVLARRIVVGVDEVVDLAGAEQRLLVTAGVAAGHLRGRAGLEGRAVALQTAEADRVALDGGGLEAGDLTDLEAEGDRGGTGGLGLRGDRRGDLV